MTRTGNCAPCFELKENICGANRGFCYAKPVPATLSISLGGLREVNDPAQYISTLYQWGVSVTGILAGIMIMVGGLLYLTAGGSPERVSNAKSYISNALIGLVLALTSYFLLQTINPALLSLQFPKTPLIQAVAPPDVVCEDLEVNPDIKIKVEEGSTTSCGGIGLPYSVSGESNVPQRCVYGLCTNPEETCEVYPPELKLIASGPAAECKPVAGVRLDVFLQNRRKSLNQDAGFFTNPTAYLSRPERAGEKEAMTNLCASWTPRSQDGKVFMSFPTANCDLLSGIGGAAFLRETVELALPVGTLVEGVSTFSRTQGIQRVASGAESAVAGTEVASTIRGSIKHPAVALILGSIIASFAIAEEVMCGVNAPIRGNAACTLATFDCKKIKSCSDYDVDIKAEKTKNIRDLSPEDYLGMTSVEMHTEMCTSNPCQLPFRCERSLGQHIPWNPDTGAIGSIAYSPDYTSNLCSSSGLSFRPIPGASSAAKCCERDVVGPRYTGFYSGKKQKLGQLCETDDNCQPPLTCTGETVTLKNVLIPCTGYQNPDPECIYGWIRPNSSTAGGDDCVSICDNDRLYWQYATVFKKEDKTLRRCQ